MSSFAVSRKGTRGALINNEDALRNGDKICNDDYFEETFPLNTHITENAHTRNLGLRRHMRVHTCMKGDPGTLEIIISVDSDRRPFFPQCLVYASSGKLRGSGVPAREGHSFEERITREEGRESEYEKIQNTGKGTRGEIRWREKGRERS